MLSVAFFLLALLAGSYADSLDIISEHGLSFQAGVNVTGAQSDERFHYRHISVSSFSLPLVLSGFLYTSIEFDASSTGSCGAVSSHLDSIVGFSGSTLTIAPFAYLLYFDAGANINTCTINVNSDFTATGGLVGKTYAKIEELSSSGTVVKTHLLGSRGWTQGSIQSSGTNGELKYVTYSSTDNSFDVDITFAVSAILGTLNVGDATITPRNLESFIEIRNYPYANVANNLRLSLYTGHAAAKASSTYKSTGTVIAGSGDSQVYIKFSGTAVVDGESAKVTVSGLEKSDLTPQDISNTFFQGVLTASGDLKAEVRLVTVDFPAGAAKISYDPSVGFGAPNAAGFLLPSAGALLLSIALFFFVF